MSGYLAHNRRHFICVTLPIHSIDIRKCSRVVVPSTSLFFLSCAERSVYAWIRQRDIWQDGRISLDEFVASFQALIPPETPDWAAILSPPFNAGPNGSGTVSVVIRTPCREKRCPYNLFTCMMLWPHGFNGQFSIDM